MIDGFRGLSWQQIIFAAVLAFIIWSVIQMITLVRRAKKDGIGMTWGEVDMANVMQRCHEMFPIQTMLFQGKEFRSGMRVRVTTIKDSVIEGEFVGMNKIQMICIRTEKQIIAQQLEKVHDMTQL